MDVLPVRVRWLTSRAATTPIGRTTNHRPDPGALRHTLIQYDAKQEQ
ncbi:hypothetical protein [Nocardioides xinjiangensis]|nr:hypothetical protein [Nocardioides sp. SYSU D00514]